MYGLFLSPKKFQLEKFLKESNTYTKINSRIAKRFDVKLSEVSLTRSRTGDCATAKVYGFAGTILSISDEKLASSFYTLLKTEDFLEKLSLAREYCDGVFGELKFFVSEKKKKVLYISYNFSGQNLSSDFLNSIFDKLQTMRDVFSTKDNNTNIDYGRFFHLYLFNRTSFLSAFFTSIIKEEYAFTKERLTSIADSFIAFGSYHTSLRLHFIGMYINSLDKFFEVNTLSRSLRINITKLKHGISFNSYSEFFAHYPEHNVKKTHGFNFSDNFMFGENVLRYPWDQAHENEDFITYTSLLKPEHILIKVKNSQCLSKYLSTLKRCLESKFIESIEIIPTCDNSAFYLFVTQTVIGSLSSVLDTSVNIDNIIRSIATQDWYFSFKGEENLFEHFEFEQTTSLTLKPTSLAKIDFDSDKPLDYRLFILQVIKAYMEKHNIAIEDIYSYSFMKMLPYTFAMNLIDFLKTGQCDITNSESWGDVLTSGEETHVKFLKELKSLSKVTLFPDFQNRLPKVNTPNGLVSASCKKAIQSQGYISSAECLDFVLNCDTTLTPKLLDMVFPSKNFDSDEFLTPESVIISNNFTENGNYKIIGVVWNHDQLQTIDSVIADGKINSKSVYTMICSLLISTRYPITSSEQLGKLLVDDDFNVYFNRNVIAPNTTPIKTTHGARFKDISRLFKTKLGKNVWDLLDHFTYKMMTSHVRSHAIENAKDMRFCSKHNHYYLSYTLCPECKKVYQLIGDYNESNPLHRGFAIYYYIPDGLMLARNFFPFGLLKEIELGIENSLYDKFFFKPMKIALDNHTPCGIVFDKIDFEKILSLDTFKNIQRLKVILVLYKKLLPHILDGSFICTNKDIFESIVMHQNFKGEILILDLYLMECSSVLNSSNTDKVRKTKALFADFLINYITSDTSLQLDIDLKDSCLNKLILDIQKLAFSEEAIRNCLNHYCTVHKMLIPHGHKLCPLCESYGISEDDIVIHSSSYFQNYANSSATYEGGEANLYQYNNHQIQKIFKSDVDLALKTKIIAKALEKKKFFEEFNATHTNVKFVTIDKVLYMESGSFTTIKGFVQDFIEDSFKISRLKSKDFVEECGYERKDVIDILINVCVGIEFLHSIGGYIGDLNGGNILIKDKVVYFIDLDGMSFDDVKNFVYTDTYIYPPSAESKNITKEDDWYSLAIQAFYYLTYSHPFRGVCEDSKVPANEVERMKKGYSVLGNHAITPPSVSIGWDFMPKFLRDFFRQTFEGTKRESIKGVLLSYKEQLNQFSNSSLNFQLMERNYPCRKALSDTAYISEDLSLIWNESKIYKFVESITNIFYVNEHFIFKMSSEIVVLNDTTGNVYTFSTVTSPCIVRALNNRLFYTNGDFTSFYVKSKGTNSDEEIIQTITRATSNPIVHFFVAAKNKFIFIEAEDSKHYAIYCNSQKLRSVDISQFTGPISTDIQYDEVTGKYLVLFIGKVHTLGVAISPNGSHSIFSIPSTIGNLNCFFSNTLYYVSNDTLCFYNLINDNVNELTDYPVTSKSIIHRKSNKFIICTAEKTYMYVKN